MEPFTGMFEDNWSFLKMIINGEEEDEWSTRRRRRRGTIENARRMDRLVGISYSSTQARAVEGTVQRQTREPSPARLRPLVS